MTKLLLVLVALPVLSCITSATYVTAPAPPCWTDSVRLEISELCYDATDFGLNVWSEERCGAFGSWLQTYLQWRDGVYGDRLCQTAEKAIDED